MSIIIQHNEPTFIVYRMCIMNTYPFVHIIIFTNSIINYQKHKPYHFLEIFLILKNDKKGSIRVTPLLILDNNFIILHMGNKNKYITTGSILYYSSYILESFPYFILILQIILFFFI
jgi:hypothetical protein